jgi:hypothetical protein
VRSSRRKEHSSALEPNPSKPDQANPNKNAWISLVLFVQFQTFQWVTGDSHLPLSTTMACGAGETSIGQYTTVSDFCNKNVD